jgi:hypothetical protein
MNGKIERWFRTLKLWLLSIQMMSNLRSMQKYLDNYQRWYNQIRSHASLGGRTPDEVWNDIELPEPISIRQVDPIDVTASVKRRLFGGDPRLPVIDVDVGVYPRKAA